jgi:hypothetical protein
MAKTKESGKSGEGMLSKKNFEGKEVKILGPTYESGKPGESDNWRKKLRSKDEMLGYLKTAERYWFSDDWYGSEKRQKPA